MHWIIIIFILAFCQILLWKGAFYPDFSLFAFCSFLYFVHDSSAVLMGIKNEEVLTKSETWHKKTNSRQLRMSDYCKMTNKEAMVLFLLPPFVFSHRRRFLKFFCCFMISYTRYTILYKTISWRSSSPQVVACSCNIWRQSFLIY